MAYLRGDYYLWADANDRLHIWACDGEDRWEHSGWACDVEGKRHADRMRAGGVSIPEGVIDEYVVMRFAEMMEEGTVAQTVDRALRHRNFGGEALAARALVIKDALRGE